MATYERQAFIAIITIDEISGHVFDMDEYLDDLESEIESSLESADFFPCMHFESLSNHDWDEKSEKLIADDDIVLLVVLQWEDETLPEDTSKSPAQLLNGAFTYHIGEDGVRGYFDRFKLYEIAISSSGIEHLQSGWK